MYVCVCVCVRVCVRVRACLCFCVSDITYKEQFKAFSGANHYDFGVTKLSYYDLSCKYQINHFNSSHKRMQHMHLK